MMNANESTGKTKASKLITRTCRNNFPVRKSISGLQRKMKNSFLSVRSDHQEVDASIPDTGKVEPLISRADEGRQISVVRRLGSPGLPDITQRRRSQESSCGDRSAW